MGNKKYIAVTQGLPTWSEVVVEQVMKTDHSDTCVSIVSERNNGFLAHKLALLLSLLCNQVCSHNPAMEKEGIRLSNFSCMAKIRLSLQSFSLNVIK